MKIITISGLDGSGKSTQIARLAAEYAKAGSRVEHFHSIQFSIANRVRRSGTGRVANAGADRQPALAPAAAITSASRLGVLARKVILRVDLIRFRTHVARLARSGCDVLLADRYFYDNIVNIAYLGHTTALMRVRPLHPTAAFYLRVDPQLIMSRGRAPEQGADYLIAKSALYEVAAARFGLTVVDGSSGESVVASAIRAAIGSPG